MKLFGKKAAGFGARFQSHLTRGIQLTDSLLEWGQLTRMAAAMSYRTIFGLIPVLVIGLVVLGAFATPAQVSDVISRVLKHAGINEIVVEEQKQVAEVQADLTSIGGLPVFAMPGATEPVKSTVEDLANQNSEGPISSSARLDDWINALVQRVRSISFTAIGLVGVAALIYAAISMLAEVEGAFNQIYRVNEGRSWMRRVPLYWSLLTLGSLLLVASFFVGERLTNWVEHLHALQALSQWRGNVLRVVAFGVTVAISTLLLLIVYTTVPNTRVKILPALAGAFMGAVLWETGKWGFTRYVQYSASYSRLYGSIGLIPLFLLWVYLTWMIVLFGLRLTYLLQYGKKIFSPAHPLRSLLAIPTTAAEAAAAAIATPLVDPTAVLGVMADAACRFKEGKPAYADDIARATHINPGVVAQLLERLALAGLLHRVDTGDEGVRYTLSKPAESIDASDLLRLGQEAVEPPRSSAAQVVARIRRAECDAVAGLSLADVLNGGSDRSGEAGGGSPAADTCAVPAPDEPTRDLDRGVDREMGRDQPGSGDVPTGKPRPAGA